MAVIAAPCASGNLLQRQVIHAGLIALAILIVLATTFYEGLQSDGTLERAGGEADLPFDFYVLALSWSPAFCASERGQNSPAQCGRGANYGFITHGLWPQFEDGWPSFCQSPHGSQMTARAADQLMDIMPDRGLIEHQWDKHGTCTGLDQAAYAARTVQATQSIAVPAAFAGNSPARMDAMEIERAFLDANASLSGDGVAVVCRGGQFTEVRICLNDELAPRACRQVNANGCGQTNLNITPR